MGRWSQASVAIIFTARGGQVMIKHLKERIAEMLDEAGDVINGEATEACPRSHLRFDPRENLRCGRGPLDLTSAASTENDFDQVFAALVHRITWPRVSSKKRRTSAVYSANDLLAPDGKEGAGSKFRRRSSPAPTR
jgi:hypothetical protein